MENKFTLRLLLFMLLLGETSFSQYTKFWIQFTDKNNNPYSLTNPLQFLSKRAIDRRTRQSISYAENDLPITPAYIDSVKKVSGVTVLNRSKWFNAITIYTTDTNALNTIKMFSFVKNTKPVRRLCRNEEVDKHSEPSAEYDTKYPFINNTKSEKNTAKSESNKLQFVTASSYSYGLSFNQVNMLGGVCMHNMGYDGKGIQIAILDVG